MSTNPFVYPPELTKDGWGSTIYQAACAGLIATRCSTRDSMFPAETSPATI